MAPPIFLERIKDERVAIVGAGPAGLNAAYHLGRKGISGDHIRSPARGRRHAGRGHSGFPLAPEILEYDIHFICQHNVEIQTESGPGQGFHHRRPVSSRDTKPYSWPWGLTAIRR